MRTNLMLLVLGSLLTLGMGSAAAQQQQAPAAPPSKFKLMSSAYSEGAMIPTQYSCADPNASSPALQWSNPPAATASFAVIRNQAQYKFELRLAPRKLLPICPRDPPVKHE